MKEIVEFLTRGKRISLRFGMTPLWIACLVCTFQNNLILFIYSYAAFMLLYFCFQQGHIDVVKFLIENGAGFNRMANRRMTPLHASALV